MALDPRWTATVDDGITNPAWDAYDATIQAEVDSYNKRFATTPGFAAVDWKLMKAVVWVESGGPSSPAWTTRAMQIGNPGDAAYGVLKAGSEGSGVIMDPQLKSDVASKSISEPKLNIRAGIAYIFTKLATYADVSVPDPADRFDHQYVVRSGDSPWAIARKVGTTMAELQALNSGLSKSIHTGQVILYRRATMQVVIAGWLSFDPDTIARKYNGGRDPRYAERLRYVLDLFKKLKR